MAVTAPGATVRNSRNPHTFAGKASREWFAEAVCSRGPLAGALASSVQDLEPAHSAAQGSRSPESGSVSFPQQTMLMPRLH